MNQKIIYFNFNRTNLIQKLFKNKYYYKIKLNIIKNIELIN